MMHRRTASMLLVLSFACQKPEKPQGDPTPAPSVSPSMSVSESSVDSFTCPAGKSIAVQLDAWKLRLESAPDEAERDETLRGLGMPPVRCAAVKPASVELGTAGLTDSKEITRVVLARYECPPSDRRSATRVQVLRPLADGRFCALGSELGADFPARDCPGRIELTYENLVSPAEKVVRRVYREPHCATPSATVTKTSFFRVEGARLTEIFTFDESTPAVTKPPVYTHEGSIVIDGGYPKVITYTSNDRCAPVGLGSCKKAAVPIVTTLMWDAATGVYRPK